MKLYYYDTKFRKNANLIILVFQTRSMFFSKLYSRASLRGVMAKSIDWILPVIVFGN